MTSWPADDETRHAETTRRARQILDNHRLDGGICVLCGTVSCRARQAAQAWLLGGRDEPA